MMSFKEPQPVLDDTLGVYRLREFRVVEVGDHIVGLYHQGEFVARFSQTGATSESIQAECARHLNVEHGWDGVLWQSGD